jgi:hypothetical protein
VKRDFFDPPPEEQQIVLIQVAVLREAEKQIGSCERCNPERAQIPFDCIMDRLTVHDPATTDYILEKPAKCPRCGHDVVERTLIAPEYSAILS